LQGFPLSTDSLTPATLEFWLDEARARAIAGRIPAYIPRLGIADRQWLAMQFRLADGRQIQVGDTDRSFALMSVIKPFVVLFLLEQFGSEVVFSTVGMLPSDQPFHSIEQLAADQGFPRNPMINSGAIALAGRLPGETGERRCRALSDWLNVRSGAQLHLDEAMLASVRSVGNETNRAIAQMLAAAGYLDAIEVALDTYNQICCLSGTVDDLARLGLLLASPHEKISVVNQRTVNALMLTCGLYEASGQFAVQIGLPAKSGVSGALLAVVPRYGAIACYSPALDDTGNSIAGLFLLEKLTRSLNLNIFG